MSDPNIDREDLDLTERVPPTFERDALDAEAPASVTAAAHDAPASDADADAAANARAVPPPIPTASRRKTSIPPPIPARALAKATGAIAVPAVRKADDDSVDVDMGSFSPSGDDDAPSSHTPSSTDAEAPVDDNGLSDWFAPVGTLPPLPPATLSPQSSVTPLPLPPLPTGTPAEWAPPARSTMHARSASPPPLPLARDARRGTLPPPTRASTAPPVAAAPAPVPSPAAAPVAAPAPAPLAAAPAPQGFPVLPSFPPPALVIEPSLPEAKDDPTPLPGPALDRDDDAWFDGAPVAEDRRSSTWNVGRPARFPFVKLAIAAVLVGGLSAMTVILVRGDHRTSARRASAALRHAPVTSDEARLATDSTQAAPAPATAQVAQPAVAAVEPAVAPAAQSTAEPAARAPAAPTAQPAAEPAAEPAVATTAPADPAPQPAPANGIAVSSEPAGATITLIDNGVASVVGKTPLAVTIDRAHSYDVVLTLPGYRTQLTHVQPKARELAVSLTADDATATAERATAIADNAAAEPERTAPTTRAVPARTADKRERSVAMTASERPTRAAKRAALDSTARPTRVAAAAKGPDGVLMVSSKPPCEIAIDGVATVLTTPQRAIKLKPGKHKVTLFNLTRKIDATYEVNIEPRKSTKLIRDFMSGN